MSQQKNPSTVIINELTRIRTTLSRMEQEEAASKQAFQTLYSEMEFYKEDCMLKIENLLLQDLLSFYDSLQWYSNTIKLAKTASDEVEEIDNLSILLDEFGDLLQARDVYPLPTQKRFDSSIHRVVEVVSTKDKEQEDLVKSVVKKGFKRKDAILRFEEVVIYKYNEE